MWLLSSHVWDQRRRKQQVRKFWSAIIFIHLVHFQSWKISAKIRKQNFAKVSCFHSRHTTTMTKGRFIRSNFCILSPLFKTIIGCVNANFWQVSDIFVYWMKIENVVVFFIQLDQKSRKFLISHAPSCKIFLQNVGHCWTNLRWSGHEILKTRIIVFHWSSSRNNWMGKLNCVNTTFSLVYKKFNW